MSDRCGGSAPGELALKTVRVPYLVSDCPVKLLPFIDVGFAKCTVWLERKVTCSDEVNEAGVVLVGILVEAASKQVLAIVVDKFLLVGQVSVTGVEALGKKQKVA
jgi:hypothetical protein